mmetsp:Transcript_66007/g.166397  ORF Transcript_66007/g.166397 Transcript_66007/m.166397 type:complete len:124 (+) Transcript_66007:708-1079(+)
MKASQSTSQPLQGVDWRRTACLQRSPRQSRQDLRQHPKYRDLSHASETWLAGSRCQAPRKRLVVLLQEHLPFSSELVKKALAGALLAWFICVLDHWWINGRSTPKSAASKSGKRGSRLQYSQC